MLHLSHLLFKMTGSYFPVFISTDATLTIASLTELVKDLNWGAPYSWLQIPDSVYSTIRKQYSSDKEAANRAGFDWYLNNYPAPSWEHVASVLYDNGCHDTLAILKDQVSSLKGKPH